MITDINEAFADLEAAEQDTIDDGHTNYSYSDLVEAVAWDLHDSIKGEFYARTLGYDPRSQRKAAALDTDVECFWCGGPHGYDLCPHASK